MSQSAPHIAIAGAGSIGCYIGGALALAGQRVTLLGRDRIITELSEHGLTVSDYTGATSPVPATAYAATTNAEALRDADIVLITVKSGATGEIADQLKPILPKSARVISLQNGVTNVRVLKDHLPNLSVLAGSTPFNVVHLGEGAFHRASSGALVIEDGDPDLTDALTAPPFIEIERDGDLVSVQWGKLLFNLNNALVALSGLPLREQLSTTPWRRLLADLIAEAIPLIRASGVNPRAPTLIPPNVVVHVLRLPTPLFRLVAGRMLKIDPAARSSMWEDFQLGRKTEIEELQGAVMRLAEAQNRRAPLNTAVFEIVRRVEGQLPPPAPVGVEAIRNAAAQARD